jgi:hypothetical protein
MSETKWSELVPAELRYQRPAEDPDAKYKREATRLRNVEIYEAFVGGSPSGGGVRWRKTPTWEDLKAAAEVKTAEEQARAKLTADAAAARAEAEQLTAEREALTAQIAAAELAQEAKQRAKTIERTQDRNEMLKLAKRALASGAKRGKK